METWGPKWPSAGNGTEGCHAHCSTKIDETRPTCSEVALECSSSDEDVSVALKEIRADFREVSLQLLGPSEWKLAAYGAFFREENITTLDVRSTLRAVQHGESSYPPGRLLILSGTLALVLALCKGRSKPFFIAFSHASNLCVWLQGRVLSYLSGVYRQN